MGISAPDGTLRRVLAGLVGFLLGGLESLALAMTSISGGWYLAVPPVVGLLVGGVWGDRGIRLLTKGMDWI